MIKKILKWTAIGVGTFMVLGLIFGSGTSDCPKQEVIEKEVIVEKEVIKEIPAQCDYSKWEELESVNARGFIVAGEVVDIMNDGMTAAYNHDATDMNRVTRRLKAKNLILEEILEEKTFILSELGY